MKHHAEFFILDNLNIVQCPTLQPERSIMFREINDVAGRCGRVFLSNSVNTLSVLRGRPVDNLPQVMDEVWLLACKHIGKMYHHCLSLRKGIG